MRQPLSITLGLFVTLLACGLAPLHGAMAGNKPNVVRQAADPLAFNLNSGTLGPFLVGGALLERKRRVVRASVSVRGLTASAPYTAWWVVFNNPGACTGGADCGPSDLTNAAANVAVFHATGFFSDAEGGANFTARLRSGRLPSGTDVFLNDDDNVGLEHKRGLKAEFHIVIRGHGSAADPNDGSLGFTVSEQLSLFNGGCPDAVGDPVDNCEDEQVFIFPAP